MKNSSRIFILVVFLLLFLASLAWMGVAHLSHILREFDHVAQVDIALMETATVLKDIQLEKEIIFSKLTASAEELAFGQANAARVEYLGDYVKGLDAQFDREARVTYERMRGIDHFRGMPEDLKNAFENTRAQTLGYDGTVRGIFKEVEKGGFQLSLEDLETTDSQQKILKENIQNIVEQVWGMVHASVRKNQHWHEESKIIFWCSLWLTVALGVLLAVFKRNMDEITRQKKDLEKLNQELDRFVHTVSHDIAGPLTTIVGYAAYLETQYMAQLDSRGQNCIKGVRKGATRLSVLIKDMLELTKMSRVKNPFARLAVQETIDAAMANCDFILRQSNARVDIVDPMPEIVADRVKLTAIFFNLISNAVKFAKKDLPAVIKIGWCLEGDVYAFYVEDNGIGIEAQHQQSIFDIFKKVHPQDQYPGSGVGLSIVREALADHGGTIRVISSLGEGSKFIFTISKNLMATKSKFI